MCVCRARVAGVLYGLYGGADMGKRWTVEEERLVRDGRVPAGRTAVAARQRCLKLGWRLTGELLGVDMTPRVHRKMYNAGTLRLIRDGVVPDGMSMQGCRYVARTRLGLGFRCRITDRESRWRARALEVMDLKERGMRVKDIAAMLGVSHQCISALLKKGSIRRKPWDRVKGRIK